jgi:hypothetical protein
VGRLPVAGRLSAVESLRLVWIRLRLSERPVTSRVASAERCLFVFRVCPAVGHYYKDSSFTELYSGSEAGSYLRPIDSCTTQLKAS